MIMLTFISSRWCRILSSTVFFQLRVLQMSQQLDEETEEFLEERVLLGSELSHNVEQKPPEAELKASIGKDSQTFRIVLLTDITDLGSQNGNGLYLRGCNSPWFLMLMKTSCVNSSITIFQMILDQY